MKMFLDSNAYSDWQKFIAWSDEIDQASEVFMSVIVLGELRFGFGNGTKAAKNERELQKFLSSPYVRVVDVDEQTSQIYGELRCFLKANGTPVPMNDIWIGAQAVQHKAELLTSDMHFKHLPQVRVRWPNC